VSFVYFAQVSSGPIKIGYARNPEARLRNHLHLKGERPVLIGVIRAPSQGEARLLEASLHRKHAAAALGGEWFSPTAEVLASVAECIDEPTPDLGYAVLIREWRKASGLRQSECARGCGIRQTTWSMWEAGIVIPTLAGAFALERFSGGALTARDLADAISRDVVLGVRSAA
jgi:DNA-binding XRE family transcriptional regulator